MDNSCEHCDNCIYLETGDFYCTLHKKMVIEDFIPVEPICDQYNEE